MSGDIPLNWFLEAATTSLLCKDVRSTIYFLVSLKNVSADTALSMSNKIPGKVGVNGRTGTIQIGPHKERKLIVRFKLKWV